MDMVSGDRRAEVRSREELRFEYVDEQGWDASCGYAALASLVRRYRGRAVDEAALLALSAPGGGAGVVKVGLIELVRLARGLGLEARPWRAGFDRLPGLLAVSAPLLVHYDRPQGHFALVLSAGPDGVVTADPARGLELLTRGQFLSRWSGIVLEVLDLLNLDAGRALVDAAVRKAKARSAVFERALSNEALKRYLRGP